MILSIFYNGTDSNYDEDFKKSGRFMLGEIVSRFGFFANEFRPENVLRIHGVGGSKTDGSTAGLGTVAGLRMRDDVQSILNFVLKAQACLEEKNKQAPSEKVDLNLSVTLMGWSRGAIGCIYAAHLLSKLWDVVKTDIKLQIKIIALDPVSGLGTNVRALDLSWTESFKTTIGSLLTKNPEKILKNLTKWWELPEYVTQFHGFYSHDERTMGFGTTMPTMLGDVSNRVFKLYEVPGTHSTLVGNLYPNGGSTEGLDSVGLSVYRSVVRKVGSLMESFNVQFFKKLYIKWLNDLNLSSDLKLVNVIAPSEQDLERYKKLAQKTHIMPTLDITGGGGRGVFLGGNKLDRDWKPDCSLKKFLAESNSKSFIDWTSETKLEKLGGKVVPYDYDVVNSGWK